MKATTDSDWRKGQVPGSVFTDLLANAAMPDPFYRDNERMTLDLAAKDYVYERDFFVESNLLNSDRVVLICHGLDTLTHIFINGQWVADTDNMHRTWEFDVKELLCVGNNQIRFHFDSPLVFVQRANAKNSLWGVDEAVPGYAHIRKAHYMFGWDWGPQIPDSGIWREVELVGYRLARLADVRVHQTHQTQGVKLQVTVTAEEWHTAALRCRVSLTSPQGDVTAQECNLVAREGEVTFFIQQPQLWWPNGYGDQPLYSVQVELRSATEVLEQRVYFVGLRTLVVRREPDAWGESFTFVVNGLPIFAKGANYIPEDNLLGRRSRARTERLLQDAVAAHFNMVRVWGGGFYPDDDFYNLCDHLGLLVWQDFMFACAVYEWTDAFAANVHAEARDNLRRIRHHACLGLLCGNNEMEEGWVNWGFPKTARHRTDYLKFFEILLPEVSKQEAPDVFYWPSSPSSGGGFEVPNDPNRGDVHYWEVWHGLKPFTEYRKYFFRFCSEFGFQSFPAMATVNSFTEPMDRNIFSYVMEAHQKNQAANGKILYYLAQNFRYPKDLSNLVYVSQVLQAEAIRYGVEHWRRNLGRCMGSIYWQLNDCWPVASWSSIDSEGRWKALHYFARQFYAPLLISAEDEGGQVRFFASNDTRVAADGTLHWALRHRDGKEVQEGVSEFSVEALSALPFLSLDFASVLQERENLRTLYLEFAWQSGEAHGEGTVLFAPAKHFEFVDPELQWTVTEEQDQVVVEIRSHSLAKYVEVSLAETDAVWSDNYFDVTPGQARVISVMKSTLPEEMDLQEYRRQLRVRSLYDTY